MKFPELTQNICYQASVTDILSQFGIGWDKKIGLDLALAF